MRAETKRSSTVESRREGAEKREGGPKEGKEGKGGKGKGGDGRGRNEGERKVLSLTVHLLKCLPKEP